MTDRKKAEEKIRENRELFHTFFDATSDIAFLKDAESRYLLVNNAQKNFFGKERKEEIIGKNDFDFMPEEAALRCHRSDQEILQTKKARIFYEKVGDQFYEIQKFPVPLREGGYGIGAFIRDITDRKQIEEQLQKSEERYRLIAENTADSIVVLDLSLKFTYVSPSTTRMKGFSVEEVLAQTIEQVMTPASLQIMYQAFEEEMAREQSGTADPARSRVLLLEEYCKDGSTLWVENTLSFIRDEQGAPKAILSVSRDITDRKKAEETIKETLNFQQVLMDAVPSPIFYKDAKGLYLGGNKAFERYLGLSPEQYIGKSVYDISPNALAEKYDKADRALLDNPGVQIYEAAVVYADGAHHQAIFHKATFANAEKEVGGLIGVILDITDRKKAEDALQESERSLRSTIDGLSANIALLDENGTIMLVNKAWRNFAEKNGIPAEKVSEGANYLQICDSADGDHSQEAAPFAQGIRDVLAGKSDRYILEYPCNSPRKQRWFIGYVTLFPGEGPRRVVVAHENNTERKLLALEREGLIKALQDKNDEMESMLYASSHDLRTPLVSIMGFNSLVQHAIKELSLLLDKDRPAADICVEARPIITEKMTVATGYITKSAEKMSGLVDGILKLSRLGRATHTPEKIDMNALVRQSLATLDFQIKQAQATVTVGVLPSCWGDRNELEQAFTNLIDNAVKYRDPARPLVINITGTAFHNRASYSIEDNGIGIKPEHYAQIWGLFSRLEPNGPVAGEGIGLAMVKRIIQRNQGKIWVESEKGAGSKFYLSLPRDCA